MTLTNYSRNFVFNENSLGVQKEQSSRNTSQSLNDFDLDMERPESEDDTHCETEKEEEPAENEQEMSTEPSPPGSATFTTCQQLSRLLWNMGKYCQARRRRSYNCSGSHV